MPLSSYAPYFSTYFFGVVFETPAASPSSVADDRRLPPFFPSDDPAELADDRRRLLFRLPPTCWNAHSSMSSSSSSESYFMFNAGAGGVGGRLGAGGESGRCSVSSTLAMDILFA